MAVLQKIRSKAGLLIGVIGLALLAFIFSDVFNSSNTLFNKFKDRAFVVDGTVVSTGEYNKRIEEYNVFREFIYGPRGSSGGDEIQNREKVYREVVDEMMLQEEAEKLGLTVTSEEMSELVYGRNISSIFYYDQEISQIFRNPQTGQFDQSGLIRFLTMMQNGSPVPEEQAYLDQGKRAWPYIENRIRTQRLREKYMSLVGSAILVNDEEAKIAYNDAKTTANFAYAVQPYTLLSDSSVTVSDAELKALYEKRKHNYRLPSELTTVSYIVKDVIPSDLDFSAVEKDMLAATEKLTESADPASVVSEYSSNPYLDAYVSLSALSQEALNFVSSAKVGDVLGPVVSGQTYVTYKLVDKKVAPDSVLLQRIAIPGGSNQKLVNHIADSLTTVIKRGKSFTALANELDPSVKDGQIGWVTEIQLAQYDANKAVFEARPGEVFRLNMGGETWLTRVAERTKPVTKVKLAIVAMPVIISERTQNTIDNELNQFISENGNLENFDKAAEAKGYGLFSDVMLTPASYGIDQTDSSTRDIIHWAFNNEIGSVKKFDYTDKKVKIVAIVKSKIDGEYMPLSEPSLSKMLKAELIRDKKADKIIADLKSKNLTSIEAYAQAMDTEEKTLDFVSFNTSQLSIGYEPIFNVYAKTGSVGQLAAPLKGEAGVYALKVLAKEDDSKEFNLDETKSRLAQENSYQLRQGVMYVLREKMDVEDNRVRFW